VQCQLCRLRQQLKQKLWKFLQRRFRQVWQFLRQLLYQRRAQRELQRLLWLPGEHQKVLNWYVRRLNSRLRL
jgi:hypothetical protein